MGIIYIYIYAGIGAVLAFFFLIDILLADGAFDMEEVTDPFAKVVLCAQVAMLYLVTALVSGALWPIIFIMRMRSAVE